MLYDGAVTKSIDLSLTDIVIGNNKLWPTDTKTITTDDLSKLTQTRLQQYAMKSMRVMDIRLHRMNGKLLCLCAVVSCR